MLYPKSHSRALDPALFANPSAEYRGAPFWAWNNKLDRDQLFRQIAGFQEMGFGGFHIHPRTGLGTPYLGGEFMDLVRLCTEEARRRGMLSWLYDEDRWPSGFAGGLVTAEERFRARHLLFTPVANADWKPQPGTGAGAAAGARTGKGTLLGRYDVRLENGRLAHYRLLAAQETPAATADVWFAYLETAEPAAWFNHQTYVDTLNKAAMERFVAVTHERYAAAVGKFFGGVIPAIFTDEPQFTHKQTLRHAEERRDLIIPFTDDLPATYEAAYGQKLVEHLPEIFWELPGGRTSLARYRYHDHVCERFAAAFADTVGGWCAAHGLLLAGHMMEEPTLQSQTAALGEAMRSYRSFQLPGIDMLCDWHEYNTAKQAQSAARQYGRPGVLSELYGITNWEFDFIGHKAQGDWQAALGVTVRVPHLALVSMAGESKRDYPASISYQSPWHREYPLIEDHFARVNAALTRGRPLVHVGVIHPIESCWLCFGPADQTQTEREERETYFKDLTDWLLFGLLDFDFICESLLPSQTPRVQGQRLHVGEMAYQSILVPGLRTIRSTTLAQLETFAAAGGDVIFAGEIPTLVDAAPSARAQALAARCRTIPFTRRRVLEAVESRREVEVRLPDGRRPDALLHQIRADGVRRYVFFCNTNRKQGFERAAIRFGGRWSAVHLDTLTGRREPLATADNGADTGLDWDFPPHGSLLLELSPAEAAPAVPAPPPAPARRWKEVARLEDPVPVTLSEPNVLLLDQALYRINAGEWRGMEELLRIENLVRNQLGLPPKGGAIAQPWTDAAPTPVVGQLELKFAVQCAVAVAAPMLALEEPDRVEIVLDGQRVPGGGERAKGWFVDEAIKTLPLPPLSAGTHNLILRIGFTRKTNGEWCYLLGDFGVEVRGRHARIIAPVRELAWGDWTRQGLPFYAGNVTYRAALRVSREEAVAVSFPGFKAPLLSLALAGRDCAKVAFAPFRAELGRLAPGEHRLDITAYGNRVNAFGPLHNTWEAPRSDPWAWRTVGDKWAYEYQLTPMGILVAPRVEGDASSPPPDPDRLNDSHEATKGTKSG
ncbi:MAG: hypothetical protein WC789_13080 [Lentisphaeria bacterium]|jgi:hypothetical protein